MLQVKCFNKLSEQEACLMMHCIFTGLASFMYIERSTHRLLEQVQDSTRGSVRCNEYRQISSLFCKLTNSELIRCSSTISEGLLWPVGSQFFMGGRKTRQTTIGIHSNCNWSSDSWPLLNKSCWLFRFRFQRREVSAYKISMPRIATWFLAHFDFFNASCRHEECLRPG